MKSRIPTLCKDDPILAPTMEERDIALQQACQAAMRILKDRAEMDGGSVHSDEPVRVPESSRWLIRRLAKERRARLAAERHG